MKLIALALAGAMSALIVAATNASAAQQYIAKPAWKAAPSRADVTAALSSKANDLHHPVDVNIGCQIKPGGALTACGQIYGSERGQEIRDAVLALIPKFIAYVPREVDPTKGSVVVTLAFHLEPPDRPAEVIELVDPQLRMIKGAAQPVRVLPDAVTKAGYKSGLGVVECEGTATGALADCSVVKETPSNLGVAQGALAIAQTMNLNPWQQDEPIEGSKVRIPIYINAPDADRDSSFTRQAIFHVLHRPPRPAGPGFPAGAYTMGDVGTAGEYFPDRALRMGVDGSAVIECVLSAEGDLDECVPVAESAPNFGFAFASLEMAKQRAITAAPRLVDGVPLDGEVVQVVVPFIAHPKQPKIR